MRRIKIIEQISLDGVIQAPGGPDEDGDYKYGGWVVPYFEQSIAEAINAAQGEQFDLLLGRHTYDIFARYWPAFDDSPMAARLNAARKYVATHRPESLAWGPVESLGADIVAELRRIKATDGPDMIVWGSSTLTSVLLAQGLVDEVLLLVCPVVLGAGKRFFSPDVEPRELALVDTKASSTGVLMNTYRPVGALRTGSFAAPPV